MLSGDDFYVELAGTTNREITSDWELAISNELYEVETEEEGIKVNWLVLPMRDANNSASYDFDFTTNMVNGVVGFVTRVFDNASSYFSTTNVIRLLNSRGICESEVVVVNEDSGFKFGMTGVATWNETEEYAYDWTGTATDVFEWNKLGESTIGSVNDNQGFRVKVSTVLRVETKTASGTPVKYSNINVLADDMANVVSSTEVFYPGQIDDSGSVDIEITGYSCKTNETDIVVSASAFGWSSEDKICKLKFAEENELSFTMSRTLAYDDFDAKRDYWQSTGRVIGTIQSQTGRRCIGFNLHNYSYGTNSYLTCLNSLSAGGRKYASISFDFFNANTPTARYSNLIVSVCTNSNWQGEIVDAVVLPNKRFGHSASEWYPYSVMFELPEGFPDSELYLRLLCQTIGGAPAAGIYVDNLRVAFQDYAEGVSLTQTTTPPANGTSKKFQLSVEPKTFDSVSDVSADLYLVLNGETMTAAMILRELLRLRTVLPI